MADFDAILRKALASRPGAPGDERRKIYERARQALVRQLTSFEPPLPPEDISRQRLALESAIRKVEADVAANGGILPGLEAAAAAAGQAPAQPAAPAAPAPVAPQPAPAPPPPPAAQPAPPPAAPTAPAPAQPAPPPPAAAPMPRVDAPTPGGPVFDPPPTFEPSPDGPASEATLVADPASADLPDFEPTRSQPDTPAPRKRSGMAGLIVGVLALILAGTGGFIAWQLGLLDPYLNQQQTAVIETPAEPALEEAPEVRTVGTDPTRSAERLLPDNQGTIVEEPETPVIETPAADPQPTEQASVPEPSGLPVAQTAILYEEGLTPDADGFTAPGRTVWRLDQSGPDPVIDGTIEVPARGITIGMRISRNTDAQLPATHLIEFTFQLSEAFPASSVAELVGVVVKPQEQSGGDPLRGAIVDLGEGVFWQALASGEADQAVNVPLLRDGAWFDLPVLYDDNRRAIVTFEKGADGEAVFAQALNAWSN
ncbi:MAG: hypothetical protein AAGH43_07610 [Pseudomonadota bacterium]